MKGISSQVLLVVVFFLSAGPTGPLRAGEGEPAAPPVRPVLRLSPEQVKAAALKETAGDAVTRYERRLHDGAWIHDDVVVKDDATYAVRIADADGVVLRYTETAIPTDAPILSFAAARKLALEECRGGRLVGYELDREHGRWLHEIKVAIGRTLHEFRIDDHAGTVLRRNQEHDSDKLRRLERFGMPRLTPEQAAAWPSRPAGIWPWPNGATPG